MAICLLQEFHVKDSLQHLLMEPKADTAEKAVKKLSCCPFCMYLGSNDPSYINHISCGHYNMNYRYRKCLKELFTTGQPLKPHMKVCKGLPKEATDEASVGDVNHTHTLQEKKKCTSKDPSPNSWLPPPQSSQESSQVSPHQSQHAKKKPTSTPKKSDSSHREEEHSSCHKHHGKDKSREKSSADKHSPKRSHKNLARSLAKNLARSPAKTNATRRRNLGGTSGMTKARPGGISLASLARSEPALPGMGGALTTSIIYGHSY